MQNVFPRRRRLLGAAAAMATGIAFPSVAQTTPIKLRVSIIPIFDTACLQCGLAKGLFAEEGLDIDTTPVGGGAAGLPALAAGQVQIAISNIISILLGAQQGLNFQMIAAASATTDQTPDLAGLVSKPDSTFSTGKQFEGKRIAVNARNGVLWLYAREWIRTTGGDPDAVTFVEVPFPQMSDALRGDRVDGAFMPEPFLSAGMTADKLHLVGWPYNVVQKSIPIGAYAATKSFVSANPAVIDRFHRAYLKSVDWTNANMGSDEFIKIVSAYTKIAPEKVKALHLQPFPKKIPEAGLRTVIDLMRRNGMLEGSFDGRDVLYKTAT